MSVSGIQLADLTKSDSPNEKLFNKVEKKYWPLTRMLATGSAQGEIDFSQMTTARKVATYVVGLLALIADLVVNLGLLIAGRRAENNAIRAFNELKEPEQLHKNLKDQLDNCCKAAQDFLDNPNDEKADRALREEMHKTASDLQLAQLRCPESEFPLFAKDFAALVRDTIVDRFKDQRVTLKSSTTEIGGCTYPIADLLLHGFHPYDENGERNPKVGDEITDEGLKGVHRCFKEGIFSPSEKMITHMFHEQSMFDLKGALVNLRKNLDSIKCPNQNPLEAKKEAESIHKKIRTSIRAQLKDRTGEPYQRLVEGAVRFIAKHNQESTLRSIREALFDTDLVALCDELVKAEVMTKEQTPPFKAAVKSYIEVGQVKGKLVNGAKALGAIAVGTAIATKLPVVGPIVAPVAGKALSVLGKGPSLLLSGLRQGAGYVGGANFENALAIGSMVAGGARELFGSAVKSVAGKLPVGLQGAAAKAAPYALPLAAAAGTGYVLYKAGQYLTTPSITPAQQARETRKAARELRNGAAIGLQTAEKWVKKAGLPAPKVMPLKQKIESILVEIHEADRLYNSAEQAAQAAIDRSGNGAAWKDAQTAAVKAQQKAKTAHDQVVQLKKEVKAFFNLDPLFAKAYEALNRGEVKLVELDGAMKSNDKRSEVEKELEQARNLLKRFEQTKLPQVKEELAAAEAIEKEIATALKRQKDNIEPGKNYDLELANLHKKRAALSVRNKASMKMYEDIQSKISKLEKRLAKVNA